MKCGILHTPYKISVLLRAALNAKYFQIEYISWTRIIWIILLPCILYNFSLFCIPVLKKSWEVVEKRKYSSSNDQTPRCILFSTATKCRKYCRAADRNIPKNRKQLIFQSIVKTVRINKDWIKTVIQYIITCQSMLQPSYIPKQSWQFAQSAT